MKKLIIMLSAKRCGSTAIFNLFQKHVNVKILHKDQYINNWEPQFWLYASKAINGDVLDFKNRVLKSLGFEKKFSKKQYDEDTIFKIFDKIFDVYGPVIFDKSPQYLGSKDSLDLLNKYVGLRDDVNLVIFAFIRNPLDAITSQHELWKHYTKEISLEEREESWLKKYEHLEKIQKDFNIKLYKYENFCLEPKKYTKDLMNYCGLSFYNELCSHLKAKSLGRYSLTPYRSIRNWKISIELEEHMKKYGYSKDIYKTKLIDKLKTFLTSIKRIILPLYQKFF